MHDNAITMQTTFKPTVALPSQPEPPLQDEQLDAARSSSLFELSETLELASLDQVGSHLATRVADATGCQVILVARKSYGKRFRLIGDSRGIEKPRSLPPGDPLEQVITESNILGSASDGTCTDTTLALETPLRTALSRRLGVPWTRVCLLAEVVGQTQAALVLLGETNEPNAIIGRFGSSSNLRELATYLRLRREAEVSWWERCHAGLRVKLQAKRTAVWAAALLSLAALLAIPVPHYVAADCKCEPATRRILTAPFDAQLADSFVKPGDVVQLGQLLAIFEGTEIASEIESLDAERKKIQQQHDSAIAKGEASVAGETALEIKRISGRLDMARQQKKRLELHSPIDGVVVSGDLEESVGASLAIGQRLLEIAPLDRMAAEVYIDEADISLVSNGQPITLRFEGVSGVVFETSVARVFPRAEMIDGENVYVAEADIEGDSNSLAPGMQGRAQVYEGWRPLAWIFFRKPYLGLRRFWGWY